MIYVQIKTDTAYAQFEAILCFNDAVTAKKTCKINLLLYNMQFCCEKAIMWGSNLL